MIEQHDPGHRHREAGYFVTGDIACKTEGRLIHMAGCAWCGLTVETRSSEESVDLIAEHVMRCEDGPVNACLEVLQQYADENVTEKAKAEIRRRIYAG